jgi:hypothetical protein
MPIQFDCPSCGKKVKAPDNMVGKKAQCPSCKSILVIPEPVYDAEEVQAESSPAPALPQRKLLARSGPFYMVLGYASIAISVLYSVLMGLFLVFGR